MVAKADTILSVVIPVFNEQGGLQAFHEALGAELDKLSYQSEIIYCNDGSTDSTAERLRVIADKDKRVRVLSLSRNFGKEIATTAGLRLAGGAGVLTLDADGQHPVELITQFVAEWEAGSKVVVGLRSDGRHTSFFKRFSSKWFYRLFNRVTGLKLNPQATDFRLIDRTVCDEFNRLTERNRINRGLIDWLGYPQQYITFKAKPRLHDDAGYSFRKLCKLAVDSVISLSSSPLYLVAYVGLVILPLSLLLGAVMAVNWLLGDPLAWHATGAAYVVVLLLCLVGILLMSQGVIGLYLSHIHSETQNRPLYIVNQEESVNL